MLRDRPDIQGNLLIVSIDDNPFPKYVKAVPCMVSGGELYTSKEIFAMLEDSNDGGGGGGSNGQCSTSNDVNEKQCSVDGYCKGDSCLGFSSINGDNSPSLDVYYSTIDEVEKDPSPGSSDDYRSQKKSSFDSEYERMMSERGEMNGGGQPQQINFSR
tara:strand:+ start:1744 stop:2217 length:474 start_codon:yes stop_codon:yes gene_type:complete